jgi:hypothetical protein
MDHRPSRDLGRGPIFHKSRHNSVEGAVPRSRRRSVARCEWYGPARSSPPSIRRGIARSGTNGPGALQQPDQRHAALLPTRLRRRESSLQSACIISTTQPRVSSPTVPLSRGASRDMRQTTGSSSSKASIIALSSSKASMIAQVCGPTTPSMVTWNRCCRSLTADSVLAP